MGDRITVSGTVEGSPRTVRTDGRLVVTSFRMRSRIDQRERIRLPPGSVPACYLVTAIDALARGVSASIRAGDHIVVAGVVVLREGDGSAGIVPELHAEAIGLDVRPLGDAVAVERPGSRTILS